VVPKVPLVNDKLLVTMFSEVIVLIMPVEMDAVLCPRKYTIFGEEMRSVFIVLISVFAPISVRPPIIVPPVLFTFTFTSERSVAPLRNTVLYARNVDILKFVTSSVIVFNVLACTRFPIKIFVLTERFLASRVPFVPILDMVQYKGITVVPKMVLVNGG